MWAWILRIRRILAGRKGRAGRNLGVRRERVEKLRIEKMQMIGRMLRKGSTRKRPIMRTLRALLIVKLNLRATGRVTEVGRNTEAA
jgi:hypothetical protein